MGSFGARVQQWLRNRLTEQHELRSVSVVVENTRTDIATVDVLARLDEALELIERYQPWRLAHLRRDLSRIWVVRWPCRGAYFPAHRTCMTELTFLARRDITAAPVAASILHEGMHARMHEMRVVHTEANHPRMERICRRAELDFGRALPPQLGAPVVERALGSLELEDQDVAPSIDWEEAMRRQNQIDRDALLRRKK